jgi:hypothetical protein
MDYPWLQKYSDREKILNHHALERQNELLGMASIAAPVGAANIFGDHIPDRGLPVARYDHSRLELIVYLLAGFVENFAREKRLHRIMRCCRGTISAVFYEVSGADVSNHRL